MHELALVLTACLFILVQAACDHRAVTCTWEAPQRLSAGTGPSIVRSPEGVVVAFDRPSVRVITVMHRPTSAQESRETISYEATVPTMSRLHRVNNILQLEGMWADGAGLQRMFRTATGWSKDPLWFRLRDHGSRSTESRLLVVGCELGSSGNANEIVPLSVHTWDGATWSELRLNDVCHTPFDMVPQWLEYDVGLAGDTVHVAAKGVSITGVDHRELRLWAWQGSQWTSELVQERPKETCPDYPVLPDRGCCDRVAYVAALPEATDVTRTIRVARRSSKGWAYTDLGAPVTGNVDTPQLRPASMTIVDGRMYLAVLAADAVVLYQEDGKGWQEQRFAVAEKPLAAEIAVDDQGAVHLVYEVRNPGSQSYENDIYYARQTCQLARR